MTYLLYASSVSGIPLLINSLKSFCNFISDNVTVYVLCSEWSKNNRATLEAKTSGVCKIEYLTINKSVFDGFKNTKGLPLETMFRLYGLELVPDAVERILYLDIDTICISEDINTLITYLNNGDYSIAAIPDAGIPDQYCSNLFKDSVKEYFNAGVICFNVKHCKSIGLWMQARKLLVDNSFVAVDQDILNIIFNKTYTPLSHRFNYMSPQIFKDMMFCRQKNMVIMKPVIIHFDGPQKPWNRICANPYKNNYKIIASETQVGRIMPSKPRGLRYEFVVFFNYLKYKLTSL